MLYVNGTNNMLKQTDKQAKKTKNKKQKNPSTK